MCWTCTEQPCMPSKAGQAYVLQVGQAYVLQVGEAYVLQVGKG